MDKSLDAIIQENSRRRRGVGARRGTGARALTRKLSAAKTAAKDATRKAIVAGKPAASAPQQAADKIVVSGLPLDVNEQQIKELFTATIGPLKDVQLHFDASGKWNGTATVHFRRKGDGTRAYEQYNNRLIDGKKPMKIELIYDPAKILPPSLASRVAPAPAVKAVPMEGVQRTGGRPGRPRRSRGGRVKQSRLQKSAADLDAEMEDYTAQSNAPSAAAATVS